MAIQEMVRRRTVLKSLAGAIPVAGMGMTSALAAKSDEVTPEARVDAAAQELQEAMTAFHGEECVIVRNGAHAVVVAVKPKPRIAEYAGDGLYEVELSKKTRPIYLVERSVLHDNPSLGRCFRLTPRYAKHLGERFMFEGDLKTALIRKL